MAIGGDQAKQENAEIISGEKADKKEEKQAEDKKEEGKKEE